jgi:NADPH:quinone reductase-like Zn-dependent oxidoreductase
MRAHGGLGLAHFLFAEAAMVAAVLHVGLLASPAHRYDGRPVGALQGLQPQRVVYIADAEVQRFGGHYLWVRPSSEDLIELGGMADAGVLTVHVEHELPLAEAARAWRLSKEGRTRGKIVLTV